MTKKVEQLALTLHHVHARVCAAKSTYVCGRARVQLQRRKGAKLLRIRQLPSLAADPPSPNDVWADGEERV